MAKTDISSKVICMVGYGNFNYLAEVFARSYGRVLYYLPYETAFPKYNELAVGTGIPKVEKITNIWDFYNDIDIFFFEDLHQGAFQHWLRSQGKIVFGAGKAEILETNRGYCKELQEQLGMPLNDYEICYGIDNLEEYLKGKTDKYIKCDMIRGNLETFHFDTYELSKPFFIALKHELGTYANKAKFYVEEPIKDAVEIGFDSFVVNGEYPDKVAFGLEIKDEAFAAVFTDYKKLPKPILEANIKFKEKFKEWEYKGWYSNEIRMVSRDKGILTDSTNRCAEPPTSLLCEMLEDYPLYVWQVANGEIPNVKAKAKFGVQIIIKSDSGLHREPQAIYFPKEYADNVKIKNHTIIDGVHYYTPSPDVMMSEIGAVVAVGDTLKKAIETCTKIASQVKGYSLDIDCSCFEKAQKEIDKLKGIGCYLFSV